MVVAATSPLLFLALLACPVGMGLLMFFMGRGMRGTQHRDRAEDAGLADLKTQQARLSAKIDALEAEREAVGRREAPEQEASEERVSG